VKPARQNERLDGAFTLAELPRLIVAPTRAQLSGVLWIERDDATRRIVYSNGWPIAAHSTAADEQIEAYLLDTAQVSAPQLQKAIAHSTAKKVELQQALSDLSLLSKTTFVEQLLALRKTIVVEALSQPARARFEKSPTDPVGFSYLPLLECAAAAVSKWPTNEHQAMLHSVGAQTLTIQGADAELAMTLGAPRTMLALMQGVTREPKTAATLLAQAANARAELVAAIATGMIQPPPEMAPVDASLDAELNDAIRVVQEKARPGWEPILPPPVERPRSNKLIIAAAVAGTAVVSVVATSLFVRAPTPVEPPPVAELADPPAAPPSSVPSVLCAAADQAREQAQKADKPRMKLNAEERARVDALFKHGGALLKKKKFDAAIKDYKAALEIDPMSAPVHRALAIACTRSGDLDQAIFEYKIYLRLAPAAPDRDSVEDLIAAYEQKHGSQP
jgi:tetratricopeptide (TPR) repeat protein